MWRVRAVKSTPTSGTKINLSLIHWKVITGTVRSWCRVYSLLEKAAGTWKLHIFENNHWIPTVNLWVDHSLLPNKDVCKVLCFFQMEPKNEILPFQWFPKGRGQNTSVYEVSTLHRARHFMCISSLQSHICEAGITVSPFTDGETEVQELDDFPRAQRWEWSVYPNLYDSKCKCPEALTGLLSNWCILWLLLVPACHRPTQLPTMISSHVDFLAQPNRCSHWAGLGLLPTHPTGSQGQESCSRSPSIYSVYDWPLEPCSRISLQFPVGADSVAVGGHLDLILTTSNPSGSLAHLSSLPPETDIYWVCCMTQGQCHILRV